LAIAALLFLLGQVMIACRMASPCAVFASINLSHNTRFVFGHNDVVLHRRDGIQVSIRWAELKPGGLTEQVGHYVEKHLWGRFVTRQSGDVRSLMIRAGDRWMKVYTAKDRGLNLGGARSEISLPPARMTRISMKEIGQGLSPTWNISAAIV